MKLHCQQSLEQPGNWDELDHLDWPAYVSIKKRSLPQGSELLNNPGYINCLSVMGLYGDGDHYAIESFGVDGIKMTLWYDDLVDLNASGYDSIGPGPRATVWTFEPMRQITERGGMWQPKLTRTLYGSQGYLDAVKSKEIVNGKGPQTCSLDETVYIDWSLFIPPDDVLTLHGIWMSKQLHDDHQIARLPHSWREWTDGVPKELCIDGRLRQQRELGLYIKPVGSQTWFLRNTVLANAIHNAGAREFDMNHTNPASVVGVTSGNIAAGGDELSFSFLSVAGEPGEAVWPTGQYNCQFDVSATGANLTFGLRAAGGSTGHFARVDGPTETADQTTNAMAQTLRSGIANHAVDTGSVSWGTPSSTDRWELLFAAVRAAGLHGNQSWTIDVNQADSFTDGPWAAVGGPGIDEEWRGAQPNQQYYRRSRRAVSRT